MLDEYFFDLICAVLAVACFLIIVRGLNKSAPSRSSARTFGSQRAHVKRKVSRPKLTLENLSVRLGMPTTELQHHEVQYETTAIPKRSGGKRILHVPDPATKIIQRKLLQQIVGRLPIHPDVHGFRRGHSIVDNAAKHVGQEVIVKLDVVDFFPSTSRKRITGAFRGAGFDETTAVLLASLTCWDGGLPQGAPTSPALSNYVNKNMDNKLAGAASARGALYTRYADDITFSFAKYSRHNIHELLISTGKILQYYGYRLNNRKKQIVRRHRQQRVTGLVVNERVNLPRKTRRWLRAVKHRIETGGDATLSLAEFKGWLSLLNMIDSESPLLEFRDKLSTTKQNAETPILETGSVSNSSESLTNEVESTVAEPASYGRIQSEMAAEVQGKQIVADAEALPSHTVTEANENHSLVKMVSVLTQTDRYTEGRKDAEAQLTGREYLIEISMTSIGRTFSFSLPKAYQSGQTVKANLTTEELTLELYCDEKLGSELASTQLPMYLTVLVEVVQWNAIFKRIEAVVLKTIP